tara:strand:+ start:177 stop:929 length:753 start_codon:yes stop_codon:yes gene_type:complete
MADGTAGNPHAPSAREFLSVQQGDADGEISLRVEWWSLKEALNLLGLKLSKLQQDLARRTRIRDQLGDAYDASLYTAASAERGEAYRRSIVLSSALYRLYCIEDQSPVCHDLRLSIQSIETMVRIVKTEMGTVMGQWRWWIASVNGEKASQGTALRVQDIARLDLSLSASQSAQVEELLSRHQHLFAMPRSSGAGPSGMPTPRFTAGRLELEVVKSEIQEMVSQGLLIPFDSSESTFPNSLDFRALNHAC